MWRRPFGVSIIERQQFDPCADQSWLHVGQSSFMRQSIAGDKVESFGDLVRSELMATIATFVAVHSLRR